MKEITKKLLFLSKIISQLFLVKQQGTVTNVKGTVMRIKRLSTKKQLLQYDKENLEAKFLIFIIFVRVIHF